MRLNKYLSDAGVCSRRQADRLIEEKRVIVNGQMATLGMQVEKDCEIVVDGKPIHKVEEKVLLAFYKPVGVECTTDANNPDNIVDYIHYPIRIYPVGRLDKNSEGLILMTNDGSIVNQIMKESNYHEKEYIVTVNKPINEAFLEGMRSGVWLEELKRMTRECTVEQQGKSTFRIVLTQGLNRQIRRMCQSLGFKVLRLKRIRIVNIVLGDLKPGEYRLITGWEKEKLWQRIQK